MGMSGKSSKRLLSSGRSGTFRGKGGGFEGVLVEVVGGAVTRCHEVCQGCELGMCGRGVREGCVF